MTEVFEKQLDMVIAEYEQARGNSKYDDASDIFTTVETRDLQTRCLAAIERAAGRQSVYFERAFSFLKPTGHGLNELAAQIGIAKSLLSDIRNGHLKSLEEIIHGDIFSDFLDMASHLVDLGFKDPSAVMAGSTLESHLRQLSTKYGITIDKEDGKPKKADTLNAELVKAGAYTKLDQKNVTAWLGLRNDAAHGDYDAYDKNQVALLISSIRDFITRNPA